MLCYINNKMTMAIGGISGGAHKHSHRVGGKKMSRKKSRMKGGKKKSSKKKKSKKH